MIQPAVVATLSGDRGLAELGAPLPLDRLVPGDGDWEVEIGFGKGKYLLRRCQEDPGLRFLGIELAAEYWRLFVEKARKRGLSNWVALRGEALYLISTVLPRGFASAVHVYFPDPWPKSRHHKRRLFDPETLDLVVGLVRPGGRLLFATDFLEYGELVREILDGYPGLDVNLRDRVWDEGPRTNYEAKYIVEGRPILRLEITRRMETAPLHPQGAPGVLAATFQEAE
ncbi:MAG TPA: tRNA (guanosine(46)-N7)-methyltransferase TrmB [Thermoanaerobaculia bacterium]|nr:tRNA (guanosine(46)-N7)-methyltransferase TrmB [Thermoanaerobaculia bacterium]